MDSFQAPSAACSVLLLPLSLERPPHHHLIHLSCNSDHLWTPTYATPPSQPADQPYPPGRIRDPQAPIVYAAFIFPSPPTGPRHPLVYFLLSQWCSPWSPPESETRSSLTIPSLLLLLCVKSSPAASLSTPFSHPHCCVLSSLWGLLQKGSLSHPLLFHSPTLAKGALYFANVILCLFCLQQRHGRLLWRWNDLVHAKSSEPLRAVGGPNGQRGRLGRPQPGFTFWAACLLPLWPWPSDLSVL